MSEAVITTDPTVVLRRVFLQRVARNPSYSLRAFARNLGVSHAYLSMILNKKRLIPAHRAFRFSQLAGLERAEAEAFIDACRNASLEKFESMESKHRRALIVESADYFRMALEQFRVLSDWYHLAILDLTLLPSFKPNFLWIAKRLGLKTAQIKSAVGRLVSLGMLEIKDNRWEKKHAKVEIVSSHFDEAFRRYHLQMIQKAIEATQSDMPDDYESRDITGTTMTVNPARLREAKARIRRFRRSLLNYVSQGRCSELYQLNVQFFPLTKNEKKRSEQ